MAGNSIRSIFVSLFVFAVILSPLMVTCDAARFTQRGKTPLSLPRMFMLSAMAITGFSLNYRIVFQLPDPYVLLVSAAHLHQLGLVAGAAPLRSRNSLRMDLPDTYLRLCSTPLIDENNI